MLRKQEGFTLLEAVFALFLFAIVLTSLLHFFGEVRRNTMYFNKKSYLMENAQAIKEAMNESIREATSFKVEKDDVLQDSLSEDTAAFILTLDEGKANEKQIILKRNGEDKAKGKYRLVYSEGSSVSPTETVISDQIDDFKCKQDAVIPTKFMVEVCCSNLSGTDREIKVALEFEEDLRYKEYIR